MKYMKFVKTILKLDYTFCIFGIWCK